ncbi:MAG: hypothetical protein LBE31_00820 [Deltaproteobacteria bacterium]|jgi:hypothetical protein|nr:hypothetical protein [Deltaproteobacteria bacterium]
MGLCTTVKVVNDKGLPVKAEVTCGGKKRGSTDENTGLLSFDLSSTGKYSISAKRMFDSASGHIIAGSEIVLRLK